MTSAESPTTTRWTRRLLFLAALFFASTYFLHLGYGDFTAWDEAAYAWRARVAVDTGDWFDQTDYALGGYYSSSFPPLLIWQMAAMFRAFGYEEWAGRFPVAAMAAIGLLALAWMAARLHSERAALCVVIALGAIPYYTHFGQSAIFDVPAISWAALTLAAWLRAELRPERRRAWIYATGVCLGLGLMTKIALPIFAWMVIVGYQVVLVSLRRSLPSGTAAAEAADSAPFGLVERADGRRYALDALMIAGAAGAIWLPWHLAMWWKHGRIFWDWYIGTHIVGRSDGSMWSEYYSPLALARPVLFHIPSATVGLAAAAVLAWAADAAMLAWRMARPTIEPAETERGVARARRLLATTMPVVWLLVVGALLQKSVTKREVYVLPLMPAIAWAAGVYFVEWVGFSGRRWVRISVVPILLALAHFFGGDDHIARRHWKALMLDPKKLTELERLRRMMPDIAQLARQALSAVAILMVIGGVAALVGRYLRRNPSRRWAPTWAGTVKAAVVVVAVFSLWDLGFRFALAAGPEIDEEDFHGPRQVEFQKLKPWLDDRAAWPGLAYVGPNNPDDNKIQFIYYFWGSIGNSANPEADAHPLPSRGAVYALSLDELDVKALKRRGSAAVFVHRTGTRATGPGGEVPKELEGFAATLGTPQLILFTYAP